MKDKSVLRLTRKCQPCPLVLITSDPESRGLRASYGRRTHRSQCSSMCWKDMPWRVASGEHCEECQAVVGQPVSSLKEELWKVLLPGEG